MTSGSSMQAMILTRPPQLLQISMSMLKTRFKSYLAASHVETQRAVAQGTLPHISIAMRSNYVKFGSYRSVSYRMFHESMKTQSSCEKATLFG